MNITEAEFKSAFQIYDDERRKWKLRFVDRTETGRDEYWVVERVGIEQSRHIDEYSAMDVKDVRSHRAALSAALVSFAAVRDDLSGRQAETLEAARAKALASSTMAVAKRGGR